MNCSKQYMQKNVFTQTIQNNKQRHFSDINLKEKAPSSQNLRKEKHSDNLFQLKHSKNSCSTNQSQGYLNETFGESQDINLLDFTFNHIQHDHPEEKIQVYSHQSPFSVILYGLMFNHLFLQDLSPRIPEMESLSKDIVKNIKAAFIQQEDAINQNQPDLNFSAIQIVQILCGNCGTQSNRKLQLAQNLTRINCKSIQQVFKQLMNTFLDINQDIKIKQKKIKKGKQNQQSQQIKKVFEKISNFAKKSGVRIKIYEQQEKRYFGSKQALLTISLRHKIRQNMFYLKQISCNQPNSA